MHTKHKASLLLLGLFGLVNCSTPSEALKVNKTESIQFPSNIILSGIPELPTRLKDAADRYNHFGKTQFASWHPTEEKMLVLSRAGATQQLHLIESPMGPKKQLTSFVDRISEATFSPLSENLFIFSKDVGGGEWYQNYRFDIPTGQSTLITDGKSMNSLGVWSHSGKWMAFGSTRRNGKDIDFYIIDPTKPDTTKLVTELQNGEAWIVLDWSPDDKQLLALEEIAINESSLWLIDIATGKKTQITPDVRGNLGAFHSPKYFDSENSSFINAKFSQDGKHVYALTNCNSDFLKLVSIDLKNNSQKILAQDPTADIEAFDISPDGRWLAYTLNAGGIEEIHLINLITRKNKRVQNIPKGVLSSMHWHPKKSLLGFSLSTFNSPGDAYSYNAVTHKLVRWTKESTGTFSKKDFSAPRLIQWESFDHRKIPGLMYSPPKTFSGKRPVIIQIHGGPESQSRTKFADQDYYFMNELGAAVIYPNIRGSTGYGKSYVKMDDKFLREDAYKDIDALLNWVQKQPTLDANKVMIMGRSYGGNVTLAVSAFYSEKIACSVDIVGISNFVTFLENTEAYRRDLRRIEYGDERDPKMRDFLNSIAPINHSEKIKKPIFVIQGQNDPRVPRSQSEQFVNAVQKNGIPVWYLLAKDEGHGFRKDSNRAYQLYLIAAFAEHCLK